MQHVVMQTDEYPRRSYSKEKNNGRQSGENKNNWTASVKLDESKRVSPNWFKCKSYATAGIHCFSKTVAF